MRLIDDEEPLSYWKHPLQAQFGGMCKRNFITTELNDSSNFGSTRSKIQKNLLL